MNLPKLGGDPMDEYSKPIGEQKTKLTKLFQVKPREAPNKPGRSLKVVWDSRSPLVDNFENNYSYLVTFERKGEVAGNHYHKHKQELFYPVVGAFEVILKRIDDGVTEKIVLNATDNKVLYIPPLVAHSVRSLSDVSSLLVIATYPNSKEDEFHYKVDL